jgi:hypothetical protein
MNDFNLQKFLVENKLTRNSKLLKEETNPSYKDFYKAFMNVEIENHKEIPQDSTEIPLKYLEDKKNNPPSFPDLKSLAQEIKDIDDTMTEDAGEYKGFYHEELLNKLEMVGKSTNFLEIDELMSLVDSLNGDDDEDDEEY